MATMLLAQCRAVPDMNRTLPTDDDVARRKLGGFITYVLACVLFRPSVVCPSTNQPTHRRRFHVALWWHVNPSHSLPKLIDLLVRTIAAWWIHLLPPHSC